MIGTIVKTHWMAEVLKDSNPDLLAFARGTPAIEVWPLARRVGRLGNAELAQKVAAHFKLTVADLDAADSRILKLIPEKLARRYQVFPVTQTDRHLYVATSEPGNFEAQQAITFASGRSAVFQVAAPEDIQNKIDCAYSPGTHLFFPSDDNRSQPVVSGYPLKLEFADRTVSSVPGRRSAPAMPPQQPRVLVVDDEAVTRLLTRSILTNLGYAVSEEADGIAALASVNAGTPFTLIVLDLGMPKMGGREVLAKLKSAASTASIPVIVLTGSTDDALEVELMEEGADDYMRKPLEPARFTARVKAVLRRRAA